MRLRQEGKYLTFCLSVVSSMTLLYTYRKDVILTSLVVYFSINMGLKESAGPEFAEADTTLAEGLGCSGGEGPAVRAQRYRSRGD